MTLVADASAVVSYLLRVNPVDEIGPILRRGDVGVPALCDVEVVAALRRLIRAGEISLARSEEALHDYLDLPLTRYGHESLLDRIIELRENFTAYDATYVALTERLGAELLTVDAGMRRAVSAHTRLSLLP